jgi:ribokinase
MTPTRVAVVGSFVQDLAFRVPRFPAPGETRIGEFFAGPGGKGSNQAVACKRQDIQTLFIGAIGQDIFGDGYVAWVANEQLEVDLLRTQTPSGAASVVIDAQAQNLIVVALGANECLTREHVLSALSRHDAISVLLVQAESSLNATRSALEYARERQILSLFNPAPINSGVTLELLGLADVITPNETEAAFLAQHVLGEKKAIDVARLDDESIIALCSQFPCSATLITLGASGSLFYQRAAIDKKIGGGRSGALVRTSVVPGIVATDTTGAGDAFNGGLAAGLVHFSGDMKRAMKYATVVAGLSTQREGTAPAMPTRAEVATYAAFYQE